MRCLRKFGTSTRFMKIQGWNNPKWETDMKKIIVVGGGAAGMFAALAAAKGKNSVTVFEKNEKLGKKLFITGKGRCNLTNAGDMEDLFYHVVTNR